MCQSRKNVIGYKMGIPTLQSHKREVKTIQNDTLKKSMRKTTCGETKKETAR